MPDFLSLLKNRIIDTQLFRIAKNFSVTGYCINSCRSFGVDWVYSQVFKDARILFENMLDYGPNCIIFRSSVCTLHLILCWVWSWKGLARNVTACTLKILDWKTLGNSPAGRGRWWDTKMGLRGLVLKLWAGSRCCRTRYNFPLTLTR